MRPGNFDVCTATGRAATARSASVNTETIKASFCLIVLPATARNRAVPLSRLKQYYVVAAFLVTFCAFGWGTQYWRLYRALDRQLIADAADPTHAAPEVLVEIRGADGEMLYRSPALGEG